MKGTGATGAAWAELLRVSALCTVPGDALAGAAAAGHRPNRGTAHAIGASLCLYEAGMALNDWADRDIDAVERPRRPLPSGRITPRAALGAATALTAAGLALAARAGRPTLATATALAATVWAYDLGLKHTPWGPPAMATARALNLTLGATATAPRRSPSPSPRHRDARNPPRRTGAPPRQASTAVPDPPRPRLQAQSAAILATHTLALTAVSRHEAQGGTSTPPLAALAAVAVTTAAALSRGAARTPPPRMPLRRRPLLTAAAATYATTAARPLLHAALNPSPQLLQRAVGAGIRATIPLQAALAARAGAGAGAAPLLALLPLARRLSRKVSPT